jgi:thiosulfate/3-mercaptopyruvate sulfurtransferase
VNYRFVDCRWSLEDPESGRRAYLEGHIPGAVYLDVERDLSAPPGPGGRHPLPDAATFAATMGRAGIGAETFVVTYGSMGGAERLWWLLRHFGHDNCAVIDFSSWHGPLAAGEEHAEHTVFEPQARDGDTISREALAERLDELVVVDVRLPARWRGEANPIDRVPGRIPGALNAPWPEPTQELPAGEPVVYCGSGVTACVVLHRLHLAGREGRLYPGSWSEWEQHPELPVERG